MHNARNIKVYSYLRFSDVRQAAGSSADRQTQYAASWAAQHQLPLDHALSLRDEGLSAYHQRHVKQGALGTFLQAIDDGRIHAGSVLVVESLDRLSRAEPVLAQAQLAQIINAGITVVTASDGREYNRERLKANPMDLVYSLLVMIRAHEESDTKSKRVKAAIRRQCEQWLAGTYRGRIRHGQDPQWLRWEDGAWHLISERVAAVQHAIDWFRAGHGATAIVDRLQAIGLSVSHRGSSVSHLYKLFRLPALRGVKTLSIDETAYALPAYYPPIMSHEAFDELQVLIRQRGRRKGKGDIPGMITGMRLTTCGYCGSAMVAQNLMRRKRDALGQVQDTYRRLACSSGTTHRRCPVGGSTSVAPIERALLDFCSDQMNLHALVNPDTVHEPTRQKLATAKARAADVETQLERLTHALLHDEGTAPAILLRKVRELEKTLEPLKREVVHAEGELATVSRKAPAAADSWRAVVTRVKQQESDARLQARQLVADTFARLVVYHRGVEPNDGADTTLDLVLVPHGGPSRVLRINRKTGAWLAAEDVIGAEPHSVDNDRPFK